MAHQIEDVDLEPEEEYDENADEDFNPEAAAADEGASSSSEEGESVPAPASKKPQKGQQKRKSEAVDELDSGDEATIQERKKKRRKADTGPVEDGESGGEGVLIKTRAQRLAEKVEKKQRRKVTGGEVTIDVDDAWARLKSIPVGRPVGYEPATTKDRDGDAVVLGREQNKENIDATASAKDDPHDMINITRRIEYAGEVTEVEERVPRSSKEAQRYLAEHPEADPSQAKENTQTSTVLRPLKRPSLFEPNPTALVKGVPPEKLRPRAPSRLDVLMAEKRAEEERAKKAEKMTTVQKSALDWRGFVDQQQGLREELDEYGKSKGRFLEREDFLGRVEFARDVAAREARLKG